MNPVSNIRFRLQVAVSVVCLALLLSACFLPGGGGCNYKDVPGKATVTKIANAEGEKVVVTFDFQADDPQKQKRTPDTFTEEISKQRFEETHPAVGQKYQTVKKEITSGSCAPELWEVSWK